MIRVVRLLLAGLLALTMPALARPVAHAADDPTVSIAIDHLDPAVPSRNGVLTVRGRVTNTSTEPITLAQALLWRDWSPITTTEGLDAALASAPTQPYGGRVTEAGAFQNLTTDQKGSIAPGEVVPFEVRAPMSALELPRTGGVYLMGVHVVGRLGRRGNATIGRARVLVPVPAESSTPSTDRIRVPTVAILSSRPSEVAPGVFSDDHLADELSVGGRLTALLKVASRPDVSFAIDPALLQAVRAMADEKGYQVRQADGATFPGTGGAVARRWLSEYAALDRSRGFRTPYAMPDMATVAHKALEEPFRRVQAATEQPGEVRDLPLLAHQLGGELDAETIAWYERLAPAAILTSTARTEQSLVAPLGSAPLVAHAATTYVGGPGPDPRTTAVHRRQRMLAETWVSAATGDSPPVHVLTQGEEAAVELDSDAPWLQRVPLGALLAEKPAEWSGRMAYTDPMRAGELSHEQIDQLRRLGQAQAAYAEILLDPAPRQRETDALVARSVSSWWRDNPSGYATWIDPLIDDAQGLLAGSQVSLTAQKTVIMSGQSGSFPMTVTNKFDHPVRVAIDFTSDQPQRLSFARHTDIEVPAGQSTTINVTGRAAANGPVMVAAQLITPEGTPIGKKSRIEVRATNLGFVGWIIVVASGVVLLAATVLRIRQVARERAAAGAAPSERNAQ